MMRTHHPAHWLPLIALAALMGGCVSMDTAAPRVETLAAGSGAAGRSHLEQGRTLYVTKCARCHAPEPVRNYSAAKWAKILPEMIDDAKLNPVEADALKAYVIAVLSAG